MSAKFLNVFTDEHQELQKQIGCMTGLFQIFDRQHILAGRRIAGHSRKRLPSGRALSTSTAHGEEQRAGSPRIVAERNQSKSLYEKQRASVESSRTSFSSSSCSSFSSLECSKTAQQESLPFGRLKSSQISKASNVEPPDASSRFDHRSPDFRDVVKDSINRDSRSLSVNTSSREESNNHVAKQRDSPRPMQLSKSMDGSYVIGINGKSRESVDLNESLRVLVKLKEAPWSFSESGEPPRSSFESRDSSLYHFSRETRRFSYDGRELSRQSLDSRESSKASAKLRELPRLSLDSREGSMRSSNFDSKSSSNFAKETDGDKRSASVVAKLMGLEAMPSLSLATREPIVANKGLDSSSKQRPNSSSRSPKSSLKDPCESIVKPIATSRVPIETAPWKQQDRIRVPPKTAKARREVQPESVYSEIEKRLKELEFRQSNKDLRALKQILDAMQAKGLLEAKKGDPIRAGDDQNLKLPSTRNSKAMHPVPALIKGSSSPRAFESPIVIMKPGKSVNKSGISPASVIPLEGLSPLRKLHSAETTDKRRAAKPSPGENSDKKNISHAARTRTVQDSSKPLQSGRERNGSSGKTTGSTSPRLQQKKLETERRSRPPLPSSDSSRPQRTSVNRQQVESNSPRGKLRRKPVQDSDEQTSECSETKNLGCPGDEVSQRSDSNISLTSQADIEVTSAYRSDTNSSFVQQDSPSPSGRAARKAASILKQKKPSIGSREEVPNKENSSSAPEQPSPVSVLDASFYQDDLPPSLPKKNPNTPKDDKPPNSDGRASRNLRSEMNHKKLQSIENLVQKLRDLTSNDDKPPATDHIASLCETQNPDHRYVSEILLASGLLLKDLSSGPMGAAPIQLHPSGHPINPDLFLVLEQTKMGTKVDQEKLRRKLVFDVVNEVLIDKLELTSSGPHLEQLVRPRKLAGSFPSGQRLLKELCFEIDRCKAETTRGESCDDDVKISDEEVIRCSEGWTGFSRDVAGVVLEIERSVFKDLIDEVVSGEAMPVSQFKSNSRRRQLFPK